MKPLTLAITLLSVLAMTACKKSKPGPGGSGGGSNSSSKSITSFVFKAADNPGLAADITGTIGADSIFLSVSSNIAIVNLKPTIIHTGTSISPSSGSAQSFSSPVSYTVTAADNTTKTYKAVVKSSVGGTVYVGSADGKLYALDADNGTLKWSYTTGGAINTASPTYYNGTVYICSGDKYLYALDAATGVLKWKFLTPGDISDATPTLYNGNLYFGLSYIPGAIGAIYSINAQTGAVNWQKTTAFANSNITIYNNIGYYGCFGGFGGFNISTGAGALNFYNWVCGPGNPLVVNGVAFLGSEGGVTLANNASTGVLIWSFSMPGGFTDVCQYSGPTVKNGLIYNGGALSKYIYAMDSATGVMGWKYLGGGMFSSPLVANNMVYAGNGDSYFYALDAYTGNLAWRFGDPGQRQVGTNNGTVAGNVVYFGSYNKNIYCLNALTGTMVWQFPTGGVVYGGPCIVTSNQVVYHPGLSGEQQ